MVIDVHTHPGFYQDICDNPARISFRREQYGLYKSSPNPMEQMIAVMDHAGIDQTVLLPLDVTTISGDTVISNEEIKKLVDLAPRRLIGFASVDPHRQDAVEVLDYAFKTLGLKGLKLNPSKQKFYPDDDLLKPIYEKCLEYNKPIMFHAGLSWEPDAPAKYSKPLNFEEVALQYPGLRFCLAHFGWPWIEETIILLLKYPNVYTDTAMLYLDSPKDFFQQVFTRNMGPLWIDRNFNDKVMFGSNSPRFRPVRVKDGLLTVSMRKKSIDRILGANAVRYLGLEE
jgi:predicted TIM-barrel fold metal-dependent hydrolase